MKSPTRTGFFLAAVAATAINMTAVATGTAAPDSGGGVGGGGASAAKESDKDPSMPATMKIMDHTLTLKENKLTPSGSYLAEYIPTDETFDNWTWLYGCRLVPDTSLEPQSSAIATARNVMERKANGDQVANAAVFKDNDDKRVAVDFLVSSDTPKTLEHNIFVYYKTPKGLVSLQLARRLYPVPGSNDKVKTFIMSIPELRGKILKELARPDMPVTQYAN